MANLITNVGLGLITALLVASDHKYVAWGTDGATASVTDTALGTESAEDRVSGTQSQQTTNTSNDTYRVVGEITATDTRAITEVGIFDASSGGNMLMHADFSTVNLESGDSIEFTINTVLDQA